MLTRNFPRQSLAHLPTPIEELQNLSRHIPHSPQLFVKRDDATGLATGGNKTRKLEFLLGDALQQGCNVIITTGAMQSNHCRQTAAACAKMGLKCALVLNGNPPEKSTWNGNLLLDELFGAEIHFIDEKRDRDSMMQVVCNRLTKEGQKPYIIPTGGSNAIGSLAYVDAVEEVSQQMQVQNLSFDRMVFASGSGGTHAGILAGVKLLDLHISVEGVLEDESAEYDPLLEKIKRVTQETLAFFNQHTIVNDEDYILHTSGDHTYGTITDIERNAIQLMARKEGILLDPVYTGRAFGKLLELIQDGTYTPQERILFWHTGGVGGLFPRAAELL